MIQQSMRLKYEPSSEPLHISAKWWKESKVKVAKLDADEHHEIAEVFWSLMR